MQSITTCWKIAGAQTKPSLRPAPATHDVHVLEGVGGGDAFNAGLLHALLHGYEPQRAVDYAIAASVLKLSVRGDANLVTEAEIAGVAAAGGGTRVAR